MPLFRCFKSCHTSRGDLELNDHVKKLIQIHGDVQSALIKIERQRTDKTDRLTWLERTGGIGFVPSLGRGTNYIQQVLDRLVADKGLFVLHGDKKINTALEAIVDRQCYHLLYPLKQAAKNGASDRNFLDLNQLYALSIEGRCSAIAALQDFRSRLDDSLASPQRTMNSSDSSLGKGEKDPARTHCTEELCLVSESNPIRETDCIDSPEEGSDRARVLQYLGCPNEVYDLQAKLLPRARYLWRWCEGACRLRGNASLTPRDVSQNWVEGSDRTTCKYCSQVCFGKQPDSGPRKTLDPQMRRAMKYFFECHAFFLPSERPTYVCHICFLRDHYNKQAGPMDQEELWVHWYKFHHSSCSEQCGDSSSDQTVWRRRRRLFMNPTWVEYE